MASACESITQGLQEAIDLNRATSSSQSCGVNTLIFTSLMIDIFLHDDEEPRGAKNPARNAQPSLSVTLESRC